MGAELVGEVEWNGMQGGGGGGGFIAGAVLCSVCVFADAGGRRR